MKRVFRVAYAMDRFMRLSEVDRWLIVETSLYLVYARLAIFTVPARTMMALGHLDVSSGALHAQTSSLPAEISPAITALDKSSRRLLFANCLVRAIALRMLLARRSIPTEIHIGARKDEKGQFAAHAWLTYQNTVLVGGEDANLLYRELVGSSHTLLQ